MNKKQFQRNLNALDWYDSLVFALALLVLMFTFCARIIGVNGSSMKNTLSEGDRLLVQSILYTPERGDLVVIDSYIDYGKPLVKRIVALGGDVVEIDTEQGLVYVNGQPLNEPYTAESTQVAGNIEYPFTVPDGTVFLIGDNRQHSTDSRFTKVGCIDERDVLGKVLFRVFPLNKIGTVK